MPIAKQPNAGFSLLQLSILLTIGALIVASTLPGGEGGSDAEKTRVTLERMRKIEEATQNFMTANQRRPYPSDITAAMSSAAYGTEITPPTDYSLAVTTHFVETISPASTTCTAGSPNMTITSSAIGNGWLVSATTGIPSATAALTQVAKTSATAPILNNAATTTCAGADFRNPLVTGGVPTKSIGLPDEFGIDGFGRRIAYMVDQRATVASRCMDLQGSNLKGALAISDESNFDTGTIDHTMWALLSYGKDGQGATSMQGAALINRIKTGNVDAATIANAFYDNAEANHYSGVKGVVKSESTATFDDIVWYNDTTKNTCCMGSCTSKKDFRISAGAGGNGTSSVAFGDVNGDGFPDLIIGDSAADQVRVIFGRKDAWPTPNTAFTTALDGTNGFVINRGTVSAGFGAKVLTGDFNGDGYADILVGSTSGGAGYAVIFGGGAWPASYTVGTTTTPTTAITISGLEAAQFSYAAVGDVNGDGYSDIILPYTNTAQRLGVIYGKASSWSDFTLSDANLDGTAGVYFAGTTLNSYLAFGTSGIADAANPRFAVCDVNGDGYGDLIIPGLKEDSGVLINSTQRLFVKLGTSAWTNSSGAIDLSSGSEPVVKLTFNTGGTNSDAVRSVYCKDINNDGYDDIIVNKPVSSTEYLYTVSGAASFTGDRDMSDAANYAMRFDLSASAPSWQDSAGAALLSFGDVNNDGKTDIIMSRKTDDPKFTIAGSTFTIDDVGTTRSDAGIAYVLYQPASWGATPGLNKNWHSNYNYNGTDGIKIMGIADDKISVNALGDMNKDGKTDLFITSDVAPGGGYLLFGKSNWTNATNYDLNCTRDISGAHCANQLGAQ